MRRSTPDNMREVMLAVKSATLMQIVATNAQADDLVCAAGEDANPSLAAAMQDHARCYRVEVPELQRVGWRR